MENSFLKPRITGERFKNHALPVTLLSDFSTLEELLVELAKQKYIAVKRGWTYRK
jgi:hypothetical protein